MAACGSGQGDVQIAQDDCGDCVQVVRETKTVEIPCTRNTYQKYTVKVPRQVTEQVPKTVTYTDYDSRQKQVPYTVNRSERRIRMQTEKYQVPVVKYYKKTVMQTVERQVPVPYFVNVPETKYRTVTEKVPVQRTKVEMEDVVKTVYDTQTRTRCVPVTKMVTKQIPVYNVVPRSAPPCPPNNDGQVAMTDNGHIDKDGDYKMTENESAFETVDINKDAQVSYNTRPMPQVNHRNSADSGVKYVE